MKDDVKASSDVAVAAPPALDPAEPTGRPLLSMQSLIRARLEELSVHIHSHQPDQQQPELRPGVAHALNAVLPLCLIGPHDDSSSNVSPAEDSRQSCFPAVVDLQKLSCSSLSSPSRYADPCTGSNSISAQAAGLRVTSFDRSLEDYLETVVELPPSQEQREGAALEGHGDNSPATASLFASMKVFAEPLPQSLVFYVSNRASLTAKDSRLFDFPLSFSGDLLTVRSSGIRKQLMLKKAELAAAVNEAKRVAEAAAEFAAATDQLVAAQVKCAGSQLPVLRTAASFNSCNSATEQFLAAAMSARGEADGRAAAAQATVAAVTLEVEQLTRDLLVAAAGGSDGNSENSSASDYVLCGVVVHIGPSQMSGHYVSYGRVPAPLLPSADSAQQHDAEENEKEDQEEGRSIDPTSRCAVNFNNAVDGAEEYQWLRFDDLSVTKVSLADDVLSEDTARNVYCLFYTKRNTALTGDAEGTWNGGAMISQEAPWAAAAVPHKIRRLVDSEDMRHQLRIAQRLSSQV
jgi:hypothetical protein